MDFLVGGGFLFFCFYWIMFITPLFFMVILIVKPISLSQIHQGDITAKLQEITGSDLNYPDGFFGRRRVLSPCFLFNHIDFIDL